MSVETVLSSIKTTLQYIAPTIATILVILASFVYGFSYLQPADKRGKYIHIAIGLLIGGFVIGAISAGAEVIINTAQTLFQ